VLAIRAFQTTDAIFCIRVLVDLLAFRTFLLTDIASCASFPHLKLHQTDPVEEGPEQTHGTDVLAEGTFRYDKKPENHYQNRDLDRKKHSDCSRFYRGCAGRRINGVP
jgi:hypothetical protein